ncbi:MAG: hypothetical protein NXY57DRAFT_981263 [Lentinula lateritia]|uniref:DUF1168-domain-containing protein n=1 Tax=Lentinula lateritia TaxID=40482 RepID=A0ABQ8VPE3_9AGAR|nr:MAG: hypothetical protein NXY57DRAFT_981263 [Lentinula lateritia]KAJ4497084.1 hypothetical protein C8R41DRAFT_760386 [Lentinula lateritia]
MSTQSSDVVPPVNRHKLTAVERQRAQLDKLLKDPTKAAYVPPPPKEKTIRPAREMMKNVQGSSAGAGSGEFHVYKASRRREYERISLLEEAARKEVEDAEFKRKREEAEANADAKTAKNRAKRQKKKGKAKNAASESTHGATSSQREGGDGNDIPLKKRRLVNGRELVFRKQGEDGEDSDEDVDEQSVPNHPTTEASDPPLGVSASDTRPPPVAPSKIVIHEDD